MIFGQIISLPGYDRMYNKLTQAPENHASMHTHTTDLKKFKSGISTVFRTVQGRGKESAVTFESRLLFFHVHRDDVRVLKKRCGTDVSLSRAYMTL